VYQLFDEIFQVKKH